MVEGPRNAGISGGSLSSAAESSPPKNEATRPSNRPVKNNVGEKVDVTQGRNKRPQRKPIARVPEKKLGKIVKKIKNIQKNQKKNKKSENRIKLTREERQRAEKQQRLNGLCQPILELMTLYGFDPEGYKMDNSLRAWDSMIEASGGRWMSFAKFVLADFAAYWKKDTPVNPPFKVVSTEEEGKLLVGEYPAGHKMAGVNFNWRRGYLLGGKAGRWLTSVMSNRSKGHDGNRFDGDSFVQSVLRVKAAMPRPGKEELTAAMVDTCKELTETKIAPDEVGCAKRSKLTDALKRVVRQCFKGQSWDEINRINPYFPSTSANYNNGRADGGGVLEIMDLVKAESLDTEESLVRVRKHFSKVFGEVDHVDCDPLYKRFEELWETCRSVAKTEPKTVELVALAEALKVRVISKGPPVTYFMLKQIQRLMHSTLRNIRQFRLIGETISREYLETALAHPKVRSTGKIVDDYLGRMTVRPNGRYYLSGDYSAATNKIQGWCSEVVVDELKAVWGLPDDLHQILRASLTGHTIQDPENAKVFLEQKSGQLMGSVTSFPVLCLVNAAVMLCAHEEEVGRRVDFSQLMCAVNGDDCAMVVNKHGDRAWEDYGSLAGLSPSVGKVYRDNSRVNMNSTEFRVDAKRTEQLREEKYFKRKDKEREKEGFGGIGKWRLQPVREDQEQGDDASDWVDTEAAEWETSSTDFDDIGHDGVVGLEMVPYVNMGLVYGLKRSEGGCKQGSSELTAFGTQDSLGACAHELMAKAPSGCRSFLLKMYINKNYDKLAGKKRKGRQESEIDISTVVHSGVVWRPGPPQLL